MALYSPRKRISINQEDYDQFWAWFGTILYKIRNHQKHILPMWIKGAPTPTTGVIY